MGLSASYKCNQGQGISDICLNTYGDINMLLKLMVDNNFSSINEIPVVGSTFYYDSLLVKDQRLQKEGIIYATCLPKKIIQEYQQIFVEQFVDVFV